MNTLGTPTLFALTQGKARAFSPFTSTLGGGTAIQSLTNAQKLSLSPATPVGTEVQVTDGFVVSGGGVGNGFFYPSGVTNGRVSYRNVLGSTVYWDSAQWYRDTSLEDGGSDNRYAPGIDVLNPWDVPPESWLTTADDSPAPLTLTHPAVQQLAAPSTAQGGVFVSGGTQDGVYANTGPSGGKESYGLLGNTNEQVVHWRVIAGSEGWVVDNLAADAIYYSLSDVATPDLATDWKNARDDSRASITVTSVTQGELDAGVTVSGAGTSADNGPYPINGNQMGFNQYVLGDFISTLNQSPPTPWSNADYGGASVTSFPWQTIYTLDNGVAPPPTVTRNDVASEANWHAYTP